MVVFRRDVVERIGGFSSRHRRLRGLRSLSPHQPQLSRRLPRPRRRRLPQAWREHVGQRGPDAATAPVGSCGASGHTLWTPARRAAFREGLRNIRSYYGDRIVTQMRERVRTGGGWVRTLEDVATLARWPSRRARRTPPPQGRGDVEPGRPERAAAHATDRNSVEHEVRLLNRRAGSTRAGRPTPADPRRQPHTPAGTRVTRWRDLSASSRASSSPLEQHVCDSERAQCGDRRRMSAAATPMAGPRNSGVV